MKEQCEEIDDKTFKKLHAMQENAYGLAGEIVDKIDKDGELYVSLDSLYELDMSDNIYEYSLWIKEPYPFGNEVFFDFIINGNKRKRYGLPKVNEIKKAVKQILN